MNNSPLDDFIFTDTLRTQLEWLFNNPERIPGPLCFYGNPANGKTSVSKLLGEHLASQTHHFNMGEYKTDGQSSGDRLEMIKHLYIYQSLVGFRKTWSRVVILDEWHNTNKKQQEAYKIPLEDYSEKHNILFILVCNTNEEKNIEDILLPAIKSRCHCISFNTKRPEREELRKLTKEAYPQLTEEHLACLPDMRDIQRAVKMM